MNKKGEDKNMEIESQIHQEICPYCKRVVQALTEAQVKANFKMHTEFCKKNPKNNEGKK